MQSRAMTRIIANTGRPRLPAVLAEELSPSKDWMRVRLSAVPCHLMLSAYKNGWCTQHIEILLDAILDIGHHFQVPPLFVPCETLGHEAGGHPVRKAKPWDS